MKISKADLRFAQPDNPYFIQGPALISFSGGRTSGYMLRQILLAHGGELPPDVIVTFANTGKERPETLDFVWACGEHWGVPIVWLEYDPAADGNFRVVSFETAARAGEPFSALLRKKSYLPNPVTRFCTIELKIRVMRDYCRSIGWDHWSNIVGLRADEMARVNKAAARTNERWCNVMPLATAGATLEHVMDFWTAQNFDLRLASFEGNCDLCFLKGKQKLIRIIQEQPHLVTWWAEAEAEAEAHGVMTAGARFRSDRPSYAELAAFSVDQGRFAFDIEDIVEPCGTECMAIDA